MGLLDKLDKVTHIAGAVGGALGSAGGAVGGFASSRGGALKDAAKQIAVDGAWGLVDDLLVQPLQDHSHYGFGGGGDRAGSAWSAALGDLGSLVGGGVHLVEAPILGREGTANVDQALQTTYREVVDQPIATLFTAASLAQSETYQGTDSEHFSPGRIFKGKLWSDAYKITQDTDRTLGQAYALMGSDDILDSARVAQYQQGTLYHVTSGTLDAVAPFLLDPALPAASVLNKTRAAVVTKPVSLQLAKGRTVEQIAASKRVQAVVQDMHANEMSAAQIRHKYGFSPSLSVLLEQAGSAEAKTSVLRAAMGDLGAVNDLDGMGSIADRSTFLQNRLERLLGDQDALRAAGFTDHAWTPQFDEFGNLANHDDWHVSPVGAEKLKKVQREIEDVHGEQQLLARWDDVHGELANTPRKTRLNDLRYQVTRSEWYQGRNGAPLRVIFQMHPHAFVNLDDPEGDIQVFRLLSHTSLSNEAREQFRNEYLHAPSGAERLDVVHRAEDAVVDSILNKHGVSEADRTKVLALAAEGRGQFQNVLSSRETNFDGKGRDRVTLPTGEVVHLPLTVSQNRNVAALVDIPKVERLAKRYSPERRARYGLEQEGVDNLARAGELGEHALELFYRAWKPTVLLRIAYPLRVALGEEQARQAAMFGAMAQPRALLNGYRNHREDARLLGDRINAKADAMEAELGRRLTGRERVQVAREIEKDYNQNERVRGYRRVEFGGYELPSALDGSGRKYLTLNSSRASFDRNLGRDQNLIEGALAKQLSGFHGTGDFVGDVRYHSTDTLEQAKWNKAYLDATTRHLGHDAVARKIIEQHLSPGKPRGLPEGYTFRDRRKRSPDYDDGMHLVTVHGPDGELVGELHFAHYGEKPVGHFTDDGIVDIPGNQHPDDGVIAHIHVEPEHRRKGIASAMYDRAREINPNLKHNTELSADGKAWIRGLERRGVDASNPNAEIKAWLHSASGAKYRAELDRTRAANMDDWLDSLRDQIESYLPTPALKQAALDKKMTLSVMEREFTGRTRPIIHGEILAAHGNGYTLGKAWDRMVDRMYQVLATGPTDVLSRHPTFNNVYARDMARQIDLAHSVAASRGQEHFRITQAEIDKMAARARRRALGEVKKNLYDIAETSDLGHALRFVSPFFNAWQEVLTVWGRLSINNFRVPVQLHNAWEAPDRAGLTYTDPNGNEYLTLPVPKFIRDHFPGGALKDVDHLQMSKRGLNLILTGLPGTGPVVGIPTALLLKDRPDIASNGIVKLLYPYGPPTSIRDAFTPTTIRNLVAANADFDNATFKRMYVAIYNKQMVDYSLGKRATAPDPAQIEEEAHKLSNLRSVLQFVLPSAPKFDTPYQPFIDAYQRLLREDPKTADERFYNEYGVDYFQLTTHMSKSVNGVPPTLEAFQRQRKYAPLIAEHPELGAMILGDIPGGEFNSAVYNYQRTHRVGPGDERMQRESLMVQDIVADPQVRAGWLEYHKNMTILEDELERRGLKSFTASGAEDLQQLKRDVIAGMMQRKEFAGWANEFGQRDDRKWAKRIDAMEQIADSPLLAGRPDIDGLRQYLEGRAVVVAELNRRKAAGGSGTLTSDANEDLLTAWESTVTQLTLGNPAFAALEHRYLDNDVVEVR